MSWIFYFVRHVLATLGLMILAAMLWTVAYFLLLLAAVVFGLNLGGALAYPAGLIFWFLVPALLIGLIFFPACALGRLLIAWTHWKPLTAIPWVWVFGFAIFYGYSHRVLEMPPSLSEGFRSYLLYLSIPLGGYWWITDGAIALFDGTVRWLRAKLAHLRP